MDSIDADVWVLTETHDELSPGPDFRAVNSAPRPATNRKHVVEGSRWVTIWSRLPLLETHIPLADVERTVAAVVQAARGAMIIYGTVLPWYTDSDRGGMLVELARQAPEWTTLPQQFDSPLCLAGDFNVNLGGPHYYGSDASKEAVRSRLKEASLVAMTDYDRTRSLRTEHDTIDHIAVPVRLASASSLVAAWGRQNMDGKRLSDHSGVAVDVNGW